MPDSKDVRKKRSRSNAEVSKMLYPLAVRWMVPQSVVYEEFAGTGV